MTQYLKPHQVAELLQLTERTLANLRSEKRGIPFVKVGRAVRYRKKDVEAYLEKNYNQTKDSQELLLSNMDEGNEI